MSNFTRYQHIEKYGTSEVEGIELGKVYVFPKIDGTNGSVWLDDDLIAIKAGSRNRELSIDNDNAGFYKYILDGCDNIHHYLYKHPTHTLFGEYLVPHTLKTYEESAWRKFYVFDVMVDEQYLNYDAYRELLEEFEIEYIPAICSIANGDSDKFHYQLESSNYLVKDGDGLGEGIVLKNYDFVNKFGRTTWAKIVRSEFKATFHKTMGHPEMKGKDITEMKIAEKYVTATLVEKEYAKIVNEMDGWSSKYIPRLLNTVYHCIVVEDMWEILKKFKNPTINFRALQNFVIHQIKQTKPGIFS